MDPASDPEDDDPLAAARGCVFGALLMILIVVLIVMGVKIVSLIELTVNSEFPI